MAWSIKKTRERRKIFREGKYLIRKDKETPRRKRKKIIGYGNIFGLWRRRNIAKGTNDPMVEFCLQK